MFWSIIRFEFRKLLVEMYMQIYSLYNYKIMHIWVTK